MSRMMTMRRALLLAPLVLAPLALGGCSSGTLQTLGLQRDPPDEFQVTTQPVLAMPPDLNAAASALPAPVPGAPRRRMWPCRSRPKMRCSAAPRSRAARPPPRAISPSCSRPGHPPPPDIRQEINTQAARDARSQTLGNRLNPFGITEAKPALVDASQERQRLQRNAALGLSPVVGSTPLVKPKSNGPLGDLLNSIF